MTERAREQPGAVYGYVLYRPEVHGLQPASPSVRSFYGPDDVAAPYVRSAVEQVPVALLTVRQQLPT